ncbi:MAG TPA: FKBP-type peptidyl-prolyl cis-trans isomerase [Lentimicrobium sp.]|nr:FKBP-type peptidyl-prolyl cis-trans isomerase [Lentimicrobium sp.]
MIKSVIFIIFLSFYLPSCKQSVNQEQKVTDQKEIREPLIKANKKAVTVEDEQIDDYIRRHQWQMNETGSGLRYAIYKKGSGPKAEQGKIAVMNYSVELITGEEIYSSKESGAKEFLIGKGGVESGLEEGILLLRVGDRAKFIIPSHLGFGLIGDQNKVPPKSTLIYDIELIQLK